MRGLAGPTLAEILARVSAAGRPLRVVWISLAALVAVVGAGVGWIAFAQRAPMATPSAATDAAAAGPAQSAGNAAPPPQPAEAPAALAPNLPAPPGISAAQWAALRAEMAQRPDGAAELARLSAWFAFSDLAQRFRQQRQAGHDPAALAALARELDAALPERLRQRELSAGEARLLKLAVLEALVTDPAEREQRLQQWQQAQSAEQARQRSAAANPALAADMQREQAFLRQQAQLVAAWQAQPAAQRDARALEQQLEALRRSSFPAVAR